MDNTELILARGEAAKSLLRNDGFMAVTNEVVNGYMGQIVNSSPEQAVERERAYAGIKAVQDIIGVLNQWNTMGQQARIAAEEALEAGE